MGWEVRAGVGEGGGGVEGRRRGGLDGGVELISQIYYFQQHCYTTSVAPGHLLKKMLPHKGTRASSL